MREIPLTNGYVALVDDADYESLIVFSWSALVDETRQTVYAHRTGPKPDGSGQTTIRMHRQIYGCGAPIVDHHDGNGLNNQRYNLRRASKEQNGQNRKPNRNSATGLKGVFPARRAGSFISRITVNRERIHLGSFTDKAEAGRAYDEAARKYFGEFARTNFEYMEKVAA